MQEWTETSENVYVKSYHDETPDRPQDKYYYPKSDYPSSEKDDRNDNNNVSQPAERTYPRHYIGDNTSVKFGRARQQGKTNLEYDYPLSEGSQVRDSGSDVPKQQGTAVEGLEAIAETEGEADAYDADGYLKQASTDEQGYLKPMDSNKTNTYLNVIPCTCSEEVDGNTSKRKGFSRILEFFRRGGRDYDGMHSYDNAGDDNTRTRSRKQDGDPHEYDNQIPGHITNPVSK